MQKLSKAKRNRLSRNAASRILAVVEQVESRIFLSAFQPGDILVYRVGTGSGTLSSASTAVFIDEYSPTGALVQSIPMPTTANGGNNPFTVSGTATSEGLLSLSGNGQDLLLAGYNATTGVASIATTNSSNTISISSVSTTSGTTLTVGSTVGMTTGDPVTISNLNGITLSPNQTPYFAFVSSTTKIVLYNTAANATAHGTTGQITNTGTYSGGGTITDATMATTQREIGVISADGTINTTTTLGSALGGSDIRGAASPDGTSLYAGGPGGAVLTTLGSTSNPTTIDSADNVRYLQVINGQLYGDTSAALGTIGSGLPTTGPLTVQQLTGIADSGTSGAGLGGPYEFAFATLNPGDTSPDTLYIADNFNDGVDKYSLVNGSWVINGEVGAFGSGGNVLAGITGVIAEPVQGGEQIFISSAGSSGTAGTIYTITDTFGYNAAGGTMFSSVPPLTALLTAPANEAFRGIAFVPQPGGGPTAAVNPSNLTAVQGTSPTLSASAFGVAVSVQWEVNTGDGTGFNPIPGATFDTLSLPNVSLSQSGNQYEAVFTNSFGSFTTPAAMLTVVTGPEFSFSTQAYTSPSTAGSVTITVNRFGDDSVDDTINYATSNGTAIAGINYTATSGTLDFPDGSTDAETFDIPLTYVPAQTGPLSFNLTLSSVVGTNSASAIIGSPATFAITSPVETITLGGSASSSLTGAITGATNASPIVITTASTAGMISGNSITISGVGGNTNANGTFFVKVLSPTTFSLFTNSTLTTAKSGNAAYTSGGTWSDNSIFNYTVDDTDGTAVISALRAGSFTGDSGTVPFTYSGTVSGSGSFSFNAGELVSASSISLPSATSTNQSITVLLGTPTGFSSGGAILVSTQSANITDVDAASQVQAGDVNPNPSSAAASVSDVETSGTFSTSFAPVNGDTNAGSSSFGFLAYEVLDFSPSTAPTLFPTPGTTVNTNGISGLSLQLFNTDANPGDNFNGHPGNFNIYFLPDSNTTTPTSGLKFTTSAEPSGLSNSQFTVAPVLLGTFSFNDTSGNDVYTPAAIPPSVETALVNDLNAGTDFRLAVTPATNGVGAVAADWDGFSANTPVLSIAAAETVNQIPEYISFQSATYSESEAGPATTITLARSGPDTDTAKVFYSTGGGSAIAGTNYVPATNVEVDFAANSPTATFSVAPINQTNQGGDKFLNITLSNPSTGSNSNIGVLANPSTATLTIQDSSTAPTQMLALSPAGAADVEENGIFDDTEFKATARGGTSAPFASFSLVDFLPDTPTSPVTAIDSATLTANINGSQTPAAGTVDFYLVSNSTSSIAVLNPVSKANGFYDTTQGVEGIGSQFGSKYLLGTYSFPGGTIGSSLSIPLTLSPVGEAELVSALNGSGKFRIAVTPEDSNVVMDLQATSISLAINAQEGTQTFTATTLTNNGSSTSNASQPLSFTAAVFAGVPDGETVQLVDASNANAVVASGVTSGGSVALNVPAGALLAGTHNLVAVYGGDGSFAPSQSAPVTQTVQIAVTSVVVNGNDTALAGVQRSMVNSIVYTFNQNVNLNAIGAFSIALNSTFNNGTLPTLHWSAISPSTDGSSPQWMVTFSDAGVLNGSIADGVYNITLNASAVTADVDSTLALPQSRTDTFYRIYGDAQGTGIVNGADYNAFLSTFNAKPISPGYLAYFNEDAGSRIDGGDYNAFLANFGKKFKNVTLITTI